MIQQSAALSQWQLDFCMLSRDSTWMCAPPQPIAKGQEIAIIEPQHNHTTEKCKSGTVSPHLNHVLMGRTPQVLAFKLFILENPNSTERLSDPTPSAQLSPRMLVRSSQILGEAGWKHHNFKIGRWPKSDLAIVNTFLPKTIFIFKPHLQLARNFAYGTWPSIGLVENHRRPSCLKVIA